MGFISQLVKNKDIGLTPEPSLRPSPTDRGVGRRIWREVFGVNTSKEDQPRPQSRAPGGSYGRSALNSAPATKRLLEAMRSMAPGGWSDDRWEQSARHWNGITYLAGHRLCEMGAQAEFQVYRKDEEHPDGKRPIKRDDPPEGDRMVRPYELVELLEHPNRQDSFGDLVYRWIQQMTLTGKALTWTVPNKLGTPMELYSIPTALAIPQPAINPDFPDGYYRIQPLYPYGPFSSYPTPATAVGAPIPAQWMMEFKYPHPLLRYDGYSPLTAARLHLDEIEMMDRSRHYAMRRGINPSAMLNFDEMEGMEALPEAEIDRIKAEFEEVLMGPENAGALFVGTPGAKLEPWGNRPVDMDYQAGWDQLVSFALGLFGITKPAAGMIDDSSYSTLFATLKQLYWLTLEPIVNRFAAKLTRFLAPFFGDDLVIEIRCRRIDDHDIGFTKVDKLANLKGLPASVIKICFKILDLPMDKRAIEDLEKAGQEQGGGMPGMPGMGAPGAAPPGAEGGVPQPQGVPGVVSPPGAAGAPPSVPEEQQEMEAERPSPGKLSQGALGPRMKRMLTKGFRWKQVYSGGYRAVIDGVTIAMDNLTGDVGRRHWNIGVVHQDGRIEWTDSGSTRAEVEAWAQQIADNENERLGRRKSFPVNRMKALRQKYHLNGVS